MELTFGEQIKIILKRKNMTIRQLAELAAEDGLPRAELRQALGLAVCQGGHAGAHAGIQNQRFHARSLPRASSSRVTMASGVSRPLFSMTKSGRFGSSKGMSIPTTSFPAV